MIIILLDIKNIIVRLFDILNVVFMPRGLRSVSLWAVFDALIHSILLRPSFRSESASVVWEPQLLGSQFRRSLFTFSTLSLQPAASTQVIICCRLNLVVSEWLAFAFLTTGDEL